MRALRRLFAQRADKRNAGVTMMELLVWIAVAGIILAGVIVTFQKVLGGNKTNTAQTQLMELQTGIRNLWANTNDFGTGDLTATLKSANQLPATMIDGANVVNPWGGSVTVTGATAQFTIQFNGVPTDACTKLSLVSAANTAGAGSGITSVKVNGSTLSIPVAPAAATAACGQSGSGASGGNTLVWTFTR